MNRISNLARALFVVGLVLTITRCQKEETQVTGKDISGMSHNLATEWYALSLDLVDRTNGYTEPIAARALSYIAFTLYEASAPGIGNKSQQVILDGLNTTLPQPVTGKEYNYAIVTNEAMATMVKYLFGASGDENLARVEALRLKFEKQFSVNSAKVVLSDSKELGRKIGVEITKYSDTDQQTYAYLENQPGSYVVPVGPGKWIPTPPDYIEKPLLPTWGNVRSVIFENSKLRSNKRLEYSASENSPMYAEAFVSYNLNNNLTESQKLTVDFWNKSKNPLAGPVCRTMFLSLDLITTDELNFGAAVEVLVRLSWTLHDGCVLAWKNKYEYSTLRPSSYIKSHINRFFIPEASASPTPDYISENAVLYKAAAEIFATFFGRSKEFTDRTQQSRVDLIQKSKVYSNFETWAKEGAYIDVYTGAHFRTSIDAGYEIGYDLSQSILNIKFK